MMSENTKQSETGNKNGEIRELEKAINTYNNLAVRLRDKLRSSMPAPFRLDPMLNFSVILGESIPVDRHIALEFFNKKFMEITDIKIENQSIVIFFKDEDGKRVIYYIILHDGIETIELWEAYLLSLIAGHIIQPINEERKKMEVFLNELMEMTGEDNE